MGQRRQGGWWWVSGWWVGGLLFVATACGSGTSAAPTPTPPAPTAAPPTAIPSTPTPLPSATPLTGRPTATRTRVPPPTVPSLLPPATQPPPATPTVPSLLPPATATPPATPTRAPTRTPTPPSGAPNIPSQFPPDGNPKDSQGRLLIDASLMDRGYQPTGMTALTFQVLARRRGQPRDGDGVKSVEFIINNAQGQTVYQHTENTPPYCAFQESSGTTCRTLPARAGLTWRPSDGASTGRPMANGVHTLQVNISGQQGEFWTATFEFRIR